MIKNMINTIPVFLQADAAALLSNGENETITYSFLEFHELWYNFGIICKSWVPAILVLCWLAAIILWDVFKRNNEIRKWILSFLVIRIPLILLLVTYVYCGLYGKFNL